MNDGWALFLNGLALFAGYMAGLDSQLASSAELVNLIFGR